MKDWICDLCGTKTEVPDEYEQERCCSGLGEQCGCMGQPVNPVFCDKCDEKIHGKIVEGRKAF